MIDATNHRSKLLSACRCLKYDLTVLTCIFDDGKNETYIDEVINIYKGDHEYTPFEELLCQQVRRIVYFVNEIKRFKDKYLKEIEKQNADEMTNSTYYKDELLTACYCLKHDLALLIYIFVDEKPDIYIDEIININKNYYINKPFKEHLCEHVRRIAFYAKILNDFKDEYLKEIEKQKERWMK